MMIKLHITLTQEQHSNVLLLAKLMDCSSSAVIRKLLDSKEREMIRAIKKLEKSKGIFE